MTKKLPTTFITPNELPQISIAAALSEMEGLNIIGRGVGEQIATRADEIMKMLATGRAIEPDARGRYVFADENDGGTAIAEDAAGTLTIGGSK